MLIQKLCNAQLRRQHCRADMVSADSGISVPCCILWCGCLCNPLQKLNPNCFSSAREVSHEEWKQFWRFQNALEKTVSAGHNTQLREIHWGQATKMFFPPHIFIFSEKEKPPNSKTKPNQGQKKKIKPNQTPKLSISFIERKEMRPNSPLAGNATVFNTLDVELMGPI